MGKSNDKTISSNILLYLIAVLCLYKHMHEHINDSVKKKVLILPVIGYPLVIINFFEY